MVGHESQNLTVEALNERAFGIAQPDRVLGQGLEHRLELERGPPDHLEQLAGRRLLFERDAQLVVPRLQLGEQPHVLNCDDGLIGKSLQQLDLGRSEWANLDTTRGQRANKFPLLTKRYE